MEQSLNQKILRWLIIKGFLSSLALLIFYFAVVTSISGLDFAQDQFVKFWYFILALAFGFGIQVGLYSYLKNAVGRKTTSKKVLVTTGTTSTAAMVSCCAHYLANILPILGITGFITIVAQYQVQLFWIGLTANLAGITYMTNKIARFTEGS